MDAAKLTTATSFQQNWMSRESKVMIFRVLSFLVNTKSKETFLCGRCANTKSSRVLNKLNLQIFKLLF
jgi:hypothetical protein